MLAGWMCLFLGIYGVHKFIEKDNKWGLIYLFTGGLFLVGWIYDIVQYYKKYEEMGEERKSLYKVVAIIWVLSLFLLAPVVSYISYIGQESLNETNESVIQATTTEETTEEESSFAENEEPDLHATDDTGLTWKKLSVDNTRYKQVLMLLGENFRAGEVNDTLKNNLSSDEVALIDKLFSYCNSHDNLPEELQETFTTFCKADEYKDMFIEDDNEFYNEVSKGFQISWSSDGTYYIDLYVLPEEDYAADKNYLDAERYVDNGCILYTFENGQYKELATVEDVIYGEMVDNVCYGFGIKLNFFDEELNADGYFDGYLDGDAFFNNARSADGTPEYYVSIYDLNRSAQANSIDYVACWNWKPLWDKVEKIGLEVYTGAGSCKSYQFTILDTNAIMDYMLVEYPSGSVEVKSYNAMNNNGYLYVIDD